MLRSTITIFICIFFLLLWSSKQSFIPVFQINDTPKVITNGYYNHAFLVLANFEHEQLHTFIKENQNSAITFFLFVRILERSPQLIQLLKQSKPILGLYGLRNEDYTELPTLFQQQLSSFKSLLDITPTYFITEGFTYSPALLMVT